MGQDGAEAQGREVQFRRVYEENLKTIYRYVGARVRTVRILPTLSQKCSLPPGEGSRRFPPVPSREPGLLESPEALVAPLSGRAPPWTSP